MAIKSNNPAASFFDFFSRSGTDAANAAPPGAAFLASGGNISDGVAPGNGYLYHVFTTPGTFIVTGSGVCEYVVVGGGGGGGNEDAGGGGGAGAFRTGSINLSAGSYPVIVGSGGAGSDQPNPAPNGRGANGGDTTFGSIISNGGGGGGSGNYNQPNKAGSSNGNASGGGGGWLNGAGGPGGAYGYAGGAGNNNGGGSTNAGGGGGAGGVGETMPSPAPHTRTAAGGPGAPAGPGYDSSLSAFTPMPATWKSVVGSTGLFAGGGGGGSDNGPDTTAPAPGGGGLGDSGGCSGPQRRGTQGVDFTGSGGGGGGGCSGGNYPGQPGGDGIVIVRYTGTPTYTTRGLIFNWDAGLVGSSDGSTIVDTTNLDSGLIPGYNQSGTTVVVNGGSFTYRTAQGGHLDTNGRISVTGTNIANALDACSSMTITCWFQSSGASRQVLVSRYGTGFAGQFNHIVDPTGDFHYNSNGAISGASGDIDNATDYWSNNTWHLCHWTYDVSDGFMRWFIDGSQVANNSVGTDSGNGLTVSSSSGFAIASRGDRLEDLDGKIGHVRIHNVALTASECAADFQAQKTRYGV